MNQPELIPYESRNTYKTAVVNNPGKPLSPIEEARESTIKQTITQYEGEEG